MEKEMKNSNGKKVNNPKEASGEILRNITETPKSKVKFEIFGEEMIEKSVKLSGNSGRVYLPPTWVGHNVKIIRID